MRIIDVCEVTKPIASPIRNAYIDFSHMTTSLVAIVTDVVCRASALKAKAILSLKCARWRNKRYVQAGVLR
ncbi:MAG: hypothetical protein ACSLEN_13095 [Candidatus Malihini olakiniferum]